MTRPIGNAPPAWVPAQPGAAQRTGTAPAGNLGEGVQANALPDRSHRAGGTSLGDRFARFFNSAETKLTSFKQTVVSLGENVGAKLGSLPRHGRSSETPPTGPALTDYLRNKNVDVYANLYEKSGPADRRIIGLAYEAKLYGQADGIRDVLEGLDMIDRAKTADGDLGGNLAARIVIDRRKASAENQAKEAGRPTDPHAWQDDARSEFEGALRYGDGGGTFERVKDTLIPFLRNCGGDLAVLSTILAEVSQRVETQ